MHSGIRSWVIRLGSKLLYLLNYHADPVQIAFEVRSRYVVQTDLELSVLSTKSMSAGVLGMQVAPSLFESSKKTSWARENRVPYLPFQIGKERGVRLISSLTISA